MGVSSSQCHLQSSPASTSLTPSSLQQEVLRSPLCSAKQDSSRHYLCSATKHLHDRLHLQQSPGTHCSSSPFCESLSAATVLALCLTSHTLCTPPDWGVSLNLSTTAAGLPFHPHPLNVSIPPRKTPKQPVQPCTPRTETRKF